VRAWLSSRLNLATGKTSPVKRYQLIFEYQLIS